MAKQLKMEEALAPKCPECGSPLNNVEVVQCLSVTVREDWKRGKNGFVLDGEIDRSTEDCFVDGVYCSFCHTSLEWKVVGGKLVILNAINTSLLFLR